jgi:predicted nucleic-acid-binding protein
VSQNNDKHHQLVVDIKNCLTASPQEYSPRVRMNQSHANEIIEEIWHWSNASAGVAEDFFEKTDKHTTTQQNLAAVVKYIYETQFEKQGWIDKEKFVNAIETIMNSVRFVELSLDNEREAISVFDHINDRGVGLSGADLIKNRIFQYVESEDDFAIISASWNVMCRTLRNSTVTRLHDPKYLLRALAWTQSEGKKITYDKLAEFWGERLKNSATKATDMAQDFDTDAVYLTNYSDLKHDVHGKFDELYMAKHLRSVQHYPLLLAIRNYSDPKVFKRVIKQVSNRTVFYVLAQERTQEFETIIPKWASDLANLGSKATIDKVDEIYAKQALIKDSDFDKLFAEISGWNYEIASDRVKIRAVLSHLSWLMDGYLGKLNADTTEYFRTRKRKNEKFGWDIDHVLPKSKGSQSEFVNGIGNLVLLFPQDNRGLQDKMPQEKKTTYIQHPIYLTKTMSGLNELDQGDQKKINKLLSEAGISSLDWDIKDWTDASMVARTKFYFDLLKHDLTSY